MNVGILLIETNLLKWIPYQVRNDKSIVTSSDSSVILSVVERKEELYREDILFSQPRQIIIMFTI